MIRFKHLSKLSSKDLPMEDVDFSEGIKATKTQQGKAEDINTFFNKFQPSYIEFI